MNTLKRRIALGLAVLLLCSLLAACVPVQEPCAHEYEAVAGIPEGTVETSGGICGHMEKCTLCGEKKLVADHEAHNVLQSTAYRYLTQRTEETAVYQSACSLCGMLSEETFSVVLEKASQYTPTSPTLAFYETGENLSYGIRWNSKAKPVSPVIAWKRETDEDWQYFDAVNDIEGEVYYCRAVISAEPGVSYQYKLIEYATETESEIFSFAAAQPDKTSFTFASFSDTQIKDESGFQWGVVLGAMEEVDFYIHSGDICQSTEYEFAWKKMLDYNRSYLATVPMMAVSGNHETTYLAGVNSLRKHFYHKIPEQASTDKGYFYSFTYGNALFVMLNTNEGTQISQEQYAWLKQVLENKKEAWTIVTMHCPMYSPGKWGASTSDQSLGLREQLHDLFVEYGVDLVIQGHDHIVSKTYPMGMGGTPLPDTEKTGIAGVDYYVDPEGPVYIMNGTTGDQLRSLYEHPKEFYEYTKGSYGRNWAEYRVEPDKITVTLKNASLVGGVTVYATWGLCKTAQ